ncbi:LOW QUALITY PROTEIN: hypothetical protein TorRG33x02_249130 [Trema orientale]|uniref:Uncharacterized protein n=1 Tax=Trema orientale TaxID=63057 RepID=A0A2P5DK87_TREOI|nr:LOW QUALITY PROTEIN: hypothetical protein TorRG33x02_249130 [Trema orientale]
MGESLLTHIVGCYTSAQVWQILELYFASQTKAKIQYKTQLQNLTKEDLSLNTYLLKVKALVDQLASVGHILTTKNHIDVIFEGLPSEYDTFVLTINTRTDTYIVAKIESLLLAQESRIEKCIATIDSSAPLSSANLATAKRPFTLGHSGNSSF